MFGWIRTRGSCLRVGGTVENTLKDGGTEKRGGETKILKRGANWVHNYGALGFMKLLLVFSGNIHIFLIPYHTWLKGKHLRCPAFGKFNVKEMCLLFDKERKFWREYYSIFCAHLLGPQTTIPPSRVPWIQHCCLIIL